MTGLKRAAPKLTCLALILFFNWMAFDGFFSIRLQDGRLFGSLIDVLNRGAPVAILAIGMTMVIATKGVDLSVGAVMAMAGAVAATMIMAGHPLPVVVLAALGVGLGCGLLNGFLVAVLELQPIVATLILMVAGRGIAQLVTEGVIVTFNDPGLAAFSAGSFLAFPMPVAIVAALTVLTVLVVRRTALGLLIESLGVNRSASTYAGINSRLLLMLVYAFCGFCAAIAGIIVTADIRGADANNAGLWLELDAILAVVIGGTSLLGGRFSILMSVLGAVIIQAMNTGILISGFPPEYNLIVKAIVIIVILLAQSASVGRLFVRDRALPQSKAQRT
ncbi:MULTISPECIES: ABC transporter permease [Phyllobacteriaceae]|jgi:ribose/xylose/arabinose/galactoside ABC-type transport system permease subunit|uniref:Sugar ABC transporter permease n=1 Tax=Mesorhizobium hungaricum TaxID=1566387 RepID=A0A1C2DZ70_9HYPH|nr:MULTISPECIES: ABC transporter permease [Mesorhizobium]MBN9234630.1 ABC transporter permease [Mesorhizobium sp.]MDQ0328890.1 simple sugar transport system permease protein [Mesorhizobium sp. YL-MeA3-2017]OCX19933.1 sugar ABC transporter permease [Mesorhizobium hungaricum]